MFSFICLDQNWFLIFHTFYDYQKHNINCQFSSLDRKAVAKSDRISLKQNLIGIKTTYRAWDQARATSVLESNIKLKNWILPENYEEIFGFDYKYVECYLKNCNTRIRYKNVFVDLDNEEYKWFLDYNYKKSSGEPARSRFVADTLKKIPSTQINGENIQSHHKIN